MSWFGDRTPQQEMLDAAEYVRIDYKLTEEELVVILLAVLGFYVDPGRDKLRRLKTKAKPYE